MGFILIKLVQGLAAVLLFLFVGFAIVKFFTVIFKGLKPDKTSKYRRSRK